MDRRVIRYHAHCMDGILAAALAARAWDVRDVFPYRHVPKGVAPDIVEGAIGVDIPFIPGMRRWVDHHASGLQFLTEAHARAYGRPIRCAIRYDPMAPSASSLLPYPEHFDALVAAVTQLDSGSFRDAEEACDLANPVLAIAATVNRLMDPDVDRALIELLAETSEDPVHGILRALPSGSVTESRARHAEHERILLREGRVTDDGLLRVDLTRYPDAVGMSPYLPYRVFGTATRYAMLSAGPHQFALRLSANPWRWTVDAARTHLALHRIAARFGGGGHPRIASVTFPPTEDGAHAAHRAYHEALGTLILDIPALRTPSTA